MKNVMLCLSCVVIVILVFFLFNSPKQQEKLDKIEYIHDTIYITSYVHDTLPLLKYQKIVELRIDTLFLHNTEETSVVDIPITQKLYNNKIDSIEYFAYVSGYRQKLDSITFQWKYPIITNEIIRTIEKKNRFGYGISAGFGYGLFNKKPDMYFGVGVSYVF